MTGKRRGKTGCLTCRTRRIKCDERKPGCERCENANFECAGYAEKRGLEFRKPSQISRTVEVNIHSASPVSTALHRECVQPNIRDDGLPLVALPVNPHPSQRPHSRARDMLGYHQYLYRTLPILFPRTSFYFWRDFLCEAAWEIEWAFNTIVALGTLHRATLLLSQENGNDRDRGLDTKIVAIQTYIRALEGVSGDLARMQKPTPLAIGVLVLMAYIECLSGNIPAAIRHTQMIQYYSKTMQKDHRHPSSCFVSPIESSLQDLELICRIVRPFPSPLERSLASNTDKLTVNLPSSFFQVGTSSSSMMLQQLLEFTSADLDLKHLVWCVYAAHYGTVSKEKIVALLQALDNWKSGNSTAFDHLKKEQFLPEPADFSLQKLDRFQFPPPSYEYVPLEFCLALALYAFYKARLLWALCLLGDEDGKIELENYIHVHQLLRYVRTALTASRQSPTGDFLSCERLRIGFSPLLYLVGRCCPNCTWLRWIIKELENVGQEGLFHNQAFATALDVLCLLEEREIQSSNSFSVGQGFVPPCRRTIALLIPDVDGRSFEAYYARPQETPNDNEDRFHLCSVARWSDVSKASVPVMQAIYQQPFSRAWLLEQPLVQKWLGWNCGTDFDLNQVVQDHITGNRLLLEVGVQ